MRNKTLEQRLNAIRAGILGANDGILTTVGVIFSLGIATGDKSLMILAGVSNLIACALSMASGEYNSVSSQKDLELSSLAKENKSFILNKNKSLKYLINSYIKRGVPEDLAYKVVSQLDDPIKQILEEKYNIELGHSIKPSEASLYSLIFAFVFGMIPLICLLLAPKDLWYPITIAGALISSTSVTIISSKMSNSKMLKAVFRNVIIVIICIIVNFIFGILL